MAQDTIRSESLGARADQLASEYGFTLEEGETMRARDGSAYSRCTVVLADGSKLTVRADAAAHSRHAPVNARERAVFGAAQWGQAIEVWRGLDEAERQTLKAVARGERISGPAAHFFELYDRGLLNHRGQPVLPILAEIAQRAGIDAQIGEFLDSLRRDPIRVTTEYADRVAVFVEREAV